MQWEQPLKGEVGPDGRVWSGLSKGVLFIGQDESDSCGGQMSLVSGMLGLLEGTCSFS